MNKIYHIIDPKYILEYSKETTALGLTRISPDAKTLCKRQATELNLLHLYNARKCIDCNKVESKLTKTNINQSKTHLFDFQKESNGCFVYWDMSNIYVGAQNTGIIYEGEQYYGNIRLNYQNIVNFIESISAIHSITVVGYNIKPIMNFLNQLKNESNILTRVVENDIIENKERFADENLQIRMLHDMLDYKPNTAILLTGDGNGFNKGVGFFNEIIRMHEIGWDIVLMAWERSCHKEMRAWAEKNGEFISLDDYYYYFTFQNPNGSNQIWRSSAQFDNTL